MRKLKNLFCKKQKPKWVDVGYHTGFYRFSKYINAEKTNFKVDGFPCIPQEGIEHFVFFSRTDLVQNLSMKDSNGWSWVIPVKQNLKHKTEMKTPMQELESRLIKIAIAKDGEVCGGVWNTISHLVSQMIDKEKQIIKDAFNEGYRQGEAAASDITPVSMDVSCFSNAESYYKETFNTKEK